MRPVLDLGPGHQTGQSRPKGHAAGRQSQHTGPAGAGVRGSSPLGPASGRAPQASGSVLADTHPSTPSLLLSPHPVPAAGRPSGLRGTCPLPAASRLTGRPMPPSARTQLFRQLPHWQLRSESSHSPPPTPRPRRVLGGTPKGSVWLAPATPPPPSCLRPHVQLLSHLVALRRHSPHREAPLPGTPRPRYPQGSPVTPSALDSNTHHRLGRARPVSPIFSCTHRCPLRLSFIAPFP